MRIKLIISFLILILGYFAIAFYSIKSINIEAKLKEILTAHNIEADVKDIRVRYNNILPYFTLGSVTNKDFKIEDLKIKFNAFFKIEIIDIKNIVFLNKSGFECAGFLQNFKNLKNLPNITIKNMVIYDRSFIEKIKNVHLTGEQVTAIVSLTNDREVKAKIFYNLGKFDISLNNKDFNFKILINEELDQFTGNFTAEINDSLYAMNHYYNNNNSLSGSQPLNVSGVLNIDKQKNIKLNDLKLSNNSIKGEGNILFPVNETNYFNMKFEYIKMNSHKDFANSLNGAFTFLENTNINLFIKDLILSEKIISNLDIKIKGAKTEFVIKEFTGLIADYGDFNLQGSIKNNNYYALLTGKLSLNINDNNRFLKDFKDIEYLNIHEDLEEKFNKVSINTDIICSMKEISLYNLNMNFNNNFNLKSDLLIKFIGLIPRIYGHIHFNEINFSKNKYPLISDFFSYISNLPKNMKKDDYIIKYQPIRNLNAFGSVNIMIDSFIFNNNTYNNLSNSINIKPGTLEIEKIFFKDKSNEYEFLLTVTVQELKPNIKLSSKIMELDLSNYDSTEFLNLQKYLYENYDLSKIILDYDLNFKNIKLKDMNLVNFKTNLNNMGTNIIKMNDLTFQAFEGNFLGNGNLILNPFNLALSYSFGNINMSKLGHLFNLSTEGFASFSGSLVTNGVSFKELRSNLASKNSFMISYLGVNNMNLDNLVEQIRDEVKYLDAGLLNIISTKSNLYNIEGIFNIEKDNIKFSDIIYHTRNTSGSMAGNISLKDYSIDLLTRNSFNIINNKLENPESTNIEVGINYSGNLEDPHISIDDKILKKYLPN